MSLEPNDLSVGIGAAVSALIATVWGFLKTDISRAHGGVEKCLAEVRTLYGNAETDRAKTRDLIDDRADKLNETITANQREVMKVLSELSKKHD